MTHPHAAGIDVHAAVHFVAVPPESAVPAPAAARLASPELGHVGKFGACTADLEMIADWLRQCGVTTVAMESTGVYWIPLFELLESRGFQVCLVDPRQSRRAPGRPKTDVLDCQWLQRLHSYGLLTASFRPDDRVVALRGYLRQRQTLIRYAGSHIQHMQKALEQMNVKLAEVVSDITGVTGMAIIGHRRRRPHHTRGRKQRNANAPPRSPALYGNWRRARFLRKAVEPKAAARVTRGSSRTCRPSPTRAAARSCRSGRGSANATPTTPRSAFGMPCIA